MQEERDYGTANISATDTLKKHVIDYLFALCSKATVKEEPIAKHTHETGFVRGVRLAKSMLWKYTPEELRTIIRNLYTHLDEELKAIEGGSLSEENKQFNMEQIADEVSLQVLEFLLVVIQYSPISTEYKEMEVFGDYQDIIKAIRTKEPVKLFAGEVTGE